jgi:hypothetical protein
VTLGRKLLIWVLATAIALGAALRVEAAAAATRQANTTFGLDDGQVPGVAEGATLAAIDNVAPSPPKPESPARWLLGTEPAMLTIGRPAEPWPLSGIRGYAVSLDRGGGSSPCAGRLTCTAAEIDLAEGDGSSLSLGTLPEGITFVRVVAVSGSGIPSPVRTAVFRVDARPPVVWLRGPTSEWSNRPVKLAALATDELSGMAATGPLGPHTAIAVDGGTPSTTPGDEATVWIARSGIHEVEPSARDAAGNLTGNGPVPAPPQRAIVRIDEDAPRVEFAAAQDPGDPDRIQAFVVDPLSGPSPNRGSIAVRRAGTRARFEGLPTRVEEGRLIARWDSDSYPLGKYEFAATGFDRAGNAGTGTDRARGGRMVLVNPLKAQLSLTAGLSRHRFGGLLRRFGGGPVAGQEVEVTETFASGAEPQQRTSVVRTGRDGGFSLHLRPGPSRDVVARFAGTPLLGRAIGPEAHLYSPTAVHMRASSATATVGGKPLVFSGTVAAAGTEASAVTGLPVELQFRYRGASWSAFRTVEADARGRFRYAYRFSDDDSRGVRFQFRAYVKGREGWPYEPGASRPVSVRGR